MGEQEGDGGREERGREREREREKEREEACNDKSMREHERAWKEIVKQKYFPNWHNHNIKNQCEYMCFLLANVFPSTTNH